MKKILLSILTIAALGAGANAQTFSDSLLSANSTNARSIVSADIDGDGDLDLLTSAQGAAELAWFENTNGLGNFGSKIIIANVSNIYMALAGDMDGDNDLDIVVVSNGLDRLIWYENTDGAGTFSAGTIITTLTDGGSSIDLADIDGDGDLDVLSTSYLDDKLAYYLNDGSGVFGSQTIISSTINGAISVQAADMNNDGNIDVLVAGLLANRILYFQNTGSLNFALPVIVSSAATEPSSVSAFDIDGDSDLDILATFAANDKIVWFENTNGTGSFGTEQIISSVVDRPFKADAGDLDNDGDLDVLSANFNDGEIVWYENTNGTGSFGTAQVISSVAQGASFVSSADIDGDGDIDVLSASYGNHKLNWYPNSLSSNCIVTIPDANFKTYLVGNTAINTNGDSEIQCSEASAFTGDIIVVGQSITDLTGIESFTSLTGLYCENNQLTSLDLTSNIALLYLNFSDNQLVTIDVTSNTNLNYISCNNNSLTALNLTANLVLNEIVCYGNGITNLSIASNTSLTRLYCQNNQLTSLDASNGNNTNFTYFVTTGNPNLTCIQVDDVAYSTTNWTNIDAASSFSLDCNGGVGINELQAESMNVYPNPTSSQITIQSENKIEQVKVFNSIGSLVQTEYSESFSVENLPNGIYVMNIVTNDGVIRSRFVKE